jgi:hypothetical protein
MSISSAQFIYIKTNRIHFANEAPVWRMCPLFLHSSHGITLFLAPLAKVGYLANFFFFGHISEKSQILAKKQLNEMVAEQIK